MNDLKQVCAKKKRLAKLTRSFIIDIKEYATKRLKIAFETFSKHELKLADLECLLPAEAARAMAGMLDKCFAELIIKTDELMDRVQVQTQQALEKREKENAEIFKDFRTSDEVIAEMAVLIDKLKTTNTKNEQDLAISKEEAVVIAQKAQNDFKKL
jgi:hypothetical protein